MKLVLQSTNFKFITLSSPKNFSPCNTFKILALLYTLLELVNTTLTLQILLQLTKLCFIQLLPPYFLYLKYYLYKSNVIFYFVISI